MALLMPFGKEIMRQNLVVGAPWGSGSLRMERLVASALFFGVVWLGGKIEREDAEILGLQIAGLDQAFNISGHQIHFDVHRLALF